MTQYRTPKKTSKHYVPEEVYKTTVHFCRQYPLWKMELDIEPDSRKATDYSEERVQSSNQSGQTSKMGISRAMIARKKELVDDVAHEVAGNMDEWLILGVGHGLTYFQLLDKGIPCGKDMYYNMRQRFYYELSKRI